MMRFFTSESLSPTSKRAWTPEGFLLCSGVPIARVGVLLYGRGEIPVQANADGIIRIIREPDEVFHDNAILSFAGKPLTDEHPPSKVTPDTYNQYTKGVVLNPHRGDGRTENSELLYADLLVQNRQTIKDVLDGKVEVSAGYDAEYEQVKPGEGKQHNIIGNHVALVQKGRCGPICSIGDAAYIGDKAMAKVKVRVTPSQRRIKATRDAIMAAFQTGDEDTLVDELDRVEEMMGNTSEGGPVDVGGKGGSAGTGDDMGGTHVHIHTGAAQDDAPPAGAAGGPPPAPGAGAPPPPAGDPSQGGGGVTLEQLASRIDQLEQAVAILAQGEGGDDPSKGPDENSPGMSGTPPDNNTGDRRRATVGDSSSMSLQYQEVISRAELLVPGLRFPTFDAAKPARVTAQSMCDLRRTTLDSAIAAKGASDAKDAILAVAGQPKNPNQYIKALSCDALSMVFNGASEIIRKASLSGGNGSGAPQQPNGLQYGRGTVSNVQDTVANINKINRERYGIQGR